MSLFVYRNDCSLRANVKPLEVRPSASVGRETDQFRWQRLTSAHHAFQPGMVRLTGERHQPFRSVRATVHMIHDLFRPRGPVQALRCAQPVELHPTHWSLNR